jgi:Uncharacterized conserved protein
MATGTESVIVQDPEVHSGEPVFRGTRVPFQTLLDYLGRRRNAGRRFINQDQESCLVHSPRFKTI